MTHVGPESSVARGSASAAGSPTGAPLEQAPDPLQALERLLGRSGRPRVATDARPPRRRPPRAGGRAVIACSTASTTLCEASSCHGGFQGVHPQEDRERRRPRRRRRARRDDAPDRGCARATRPPRRRGRPGPPRGTPRPAGRTCRAPSAGATMWSVPPTAGLRPARIREIVTSTVSKIGMPSAMTGTTIDIGGRGSGVQREARARRARTRARARPCRP